MTESVAIKEGRVTPENVEIGDFVQYGMVTDTAVLEVIGKTPKGIKLRDAKNNGIQHVNTDGIILSEVEADPDGSLVTLRERKNGGFRIARSYGIINFARTIDGVPVERMDMNF